MKQIKEIKRKRKIYSRCDYVEKCSNEQCYHRKPHEFDEELGCGASTYCPFAWGKLVECRPLVKPKVKKSNN